MEEWCKILANEKKPDVVPKGWFTVAGMAEKMGKSRPHMSHMIAAAFARGELEKKSFRIATGRGSFCVPHYKPLKK